MLKRGVLAGLVACVPGMAFTQVQGVTQSDAARGLADYQGVRMGRTFGFTVGDDRGGPVADRLTAFHRERNDRDRIPDTIRKSSLMGQLLADSSRGRTMTLLLEESRVVRDAHEDRSIYAIPVDDGRLCVIIEGVGGACVTGLSNGIVLQFKALPDGGMGVGALVASSVETVTAESADGAIEDISIADGGFVRMFPAGSVPISLVIRSSDGRHRRMVLGAPPRKR
jgi:hypothetical protein